MSKNKKSPPTEHLFKGTPSLPTISSVVVVSDGRAGHLSQSLGVAGALGFPSPTIVTLRPRVNLTWWGWLPKSWCFHGLSSIPAADVTLGTGFQVSRILRHLRQRGAFTVAMQRPSCTLAEYDVVALPAHDVQAGTALPPNVILTTGAPSTITPQLLAEESDRWYSRLQHLPQPHLAVLIGGDSKHGPLTPTSVTSLITSMLTWAQLTGGSLLISTSRRTSAACLEVLQRHLSTTPVPHYLYVPNSTDNPYTAFLAMAQGVVITHESVAMVSQAATAGKPVCGWGDVTQLPLKFQRFYALLQQQHRWQPWPTGGNPTFRQPKQPLNDAAAIAGFIHGRWLQHQLQR